MRLIKSTTVALMASMMFADAGFCLTSTDSDQSNHVADSPAVKRDFRVFGLQIDGNHSVSQDDILQRIRTKAGDRYDRNQITEDLKAINAMGYFDDASLIATPEPKDDGVLVKFHVQEYPVVKQFCFHGNTVLRSSDLLKMFANQVGKPENLMQLSNAIDQVEATYHEQEYIHARIIDMFLKPRTGGTAPRIMLPAQMLPCEYEYYQWCRTIHEI